MSSLLLLVVISIGYVSAHESMQGRRVRFPSEIKSQGDTGAKMYGTESQVQPIIITAGNGLLATPHFVLPKVSSLEHPFGQVGSKGYAEGIIIPYDHSTKSQQDFHQTVPPPQQTAYFTPGQAVLFHRLHSSTAYNIPTPPTHLSQVLNKPTQALHQKNKPSQQQQSDRHRFSPQKPSYEQLKQLNPSQHGKQQIHASGMQFIKDGNQHPDVASYRYSIVTNHGPPRDSSPDEFEMEITHGVSDYPSYQLSNPQSTKPYPATGQQYYTSPQHAKGQSTPYKAKGHTTVSQKPETFEESEEFSDDFFDFDQGIPDWEIKGNFEGAHLESDFFDKNKQGSRLKLNNFPFKENPKNLNGNQPSKITFSNHENKNQKSNLNWPPTSNFPSFEKANKNLNGNRPSTNIFPLFESKNKHSNRNQSPTNNYPPSGNANKNSNGNRPPTGNYPFYENKNKNSNGNRPPTNNFPHYENKNNNLNENRPPKYNFSPQQNTNKNLNGNRPPKYNFSPQQNTNKNSNGNRPPKYNFSPQENTNENSNGSRPPKYNFSPQENTNENSNGSRPPKYNFSPQENTNENSNGSRPPKYNFSPQENTNENSNGNRPHKYNFEGYTFEEEEQPKRQDINSFFNPSSNQGKFLETPSFQTKSYNGYFPTQGNSDYKRGEVKSDFPVTHQTVQNRNKEKNSVPKFPLNFDSIESIDPSADFSGENFSSEFDFEEIPFKNEEKELSNKNNKSHSGFPLKAFKNLQEQQPLQEFNFNFDFPEQSFKSNGKEDSNENFEFDFSQKTSRKQPNGHANSNFNFDFDYPNQNKKKEGGSSEASNFGSEWIPINAPEGAVPAKSYNIPPPDLSKGSFHESTQFRRERPSEQNDGNLVYGFQKQGNSEGVVSAVFRVKQ